MSANAKLTFALIASAALHFSLIYGIGIGAARSVRSVPLQIELTTSPMRDGGTSQSSPGKVAARAHAIAPRSSGAPIAAPAVVQSARDTATGLNQAADSMPAAAPPLRIREDDMLPKADVPLLVDPTWYEAKELDRYPAMLKPVQPAYPALAALQNVSGLVTLLLRIDETGDVRDANVVSAQPEGYFEDAALQAIENARFSPGQRDGVPVRSQLIIKLRFAPAIQKSDADRS
ncbi:MAG: energy transducer TonB [Betaproteobacteria bacterium]